jgi:transglutaminase-like putative cysteine protease
VTINPVGLKAWGLKSVLTDRELSVRNVPPFTEEAMAAPHLSFYPYVVARFLKSDLDRKRYESWDSYARWYYQTFKDAAFEKGSSPSTVPATIELIKAMQQPLRDNITYRQVYLSNARGYVPEPGKEVMKKAYGDCKDMASCFANACREKGVTVYPVLANIVDGAYLTPDHVPCPMFNHLISAIPLDKSLGLPAEVVVGGERYLIYDSPATPLLGGCPRDTRAATC